METPLPTPPFHPIPNINNLRDAALYPLRTATGPLRPGLLFRSAEVSQLSRQGWEAVHALGVSHVFDLRSRPEVERGWTGTVDGSRKTAPPSHDHNDDDEMKKNPPEKGGKEEEEENTPPHEPGSNLALDPQPGWLSTLQQAGVTRTWTPVFADTDYSPERLAGRYMKYMEESVTGFVDAYRDILRNGGAAYRTILLYLAGLDVNSGDDGKGKEKGKGALVHCTAGKDRTGMFFGVLFEFLGVDRRDIAGEYQLTELGLRHVREDVVARLMRSGGFRQYMLSLQAGTRPLSREELGGVLERAKEGGGQGVKEEEEIVLSEEVLEKGRQAALRMIGARKESMLGALEMVDREWGSAEGYLRKECGLGDGELEALRRNLVVSE